MNNSKLERYNLGNLNCEFTIDELVGKYKIINSISTRNRK
jgi:hypothetical protein